MGKKHDSEEQGTFDPYRIWLAGLGAAARSEEEGSSLFDELADQGRAVVAGSGKKMRRRMEEIGDQLQQWVQATGRDVGSWFGRQVTGAARKAGLPSGDDVEELSRRVGELASRLETVERGRRAHPASRRRTPAADAATPEVHVLFADDLWQVKVGGQGQAASQHPTKAPAVQAARALARSRRPSLLVVHTRDGAMQSRLKVE